MLNSLWKNCFAQKEQEQKTSKSKHFSNSNLIILLLFWVFIFKFKKSLLKVAYFCYIKRDSSAVLTSIKWCFFHLGCQTAYVSSPIRIQNCSSIFSLLQHLLHKDNFQSEWFLINFLMFFKFLKIDLKYFAKFK